jgi:acyl dehydratase
VTGEPLADYRVKARNTSATSDNKIHDDATARGLGFRGGLVPGVTLYAYLTEPLVAGLGPAWLERGTASVRFLKPVVDGEEVTVTAAVTARDARSTTLAVIGATAAAPEAATLTATLPSGSPTPVNLALYRTAPLPAPRPDATREHLGALDTLGTPVATYDEPAALEWLEKVGDPLPLYRGARGWVHPAFFLHLANRALTLNVRLGPWIHAGSVVRHLGGARVGDTLATRGRVRSLFEKRGREFVELDLVILAGTGPRPRPVAHVLHTAVYQLGGPDMAPQPPHGGAPAERDAPPSAATPA